MLTIMCGLPGSGKSTYAQDHFDYIVCPDVIRMEFGVEFDQAIEKEVWRIAYRSLRDGLDLNLDVCFDATSVTKKRRSALLAIAQEVGVEVHCVYLATPPYECAKRNSIRAKPVPEDAFRRMFTNLQEPSDDEGFDSITTILEY